MKAHRPVLSLLVAFISLAVVLTSGTTVIFAETKSLSDNTVNQSIQSQWIDTFLAGKKVHLSELDIRRLTSNKDQISDRYVVAVTDRSFSENNMATIYRKCDTTPPQEYPRRDIPVGGGKFVVFPKPEGMTISEFIEKLNNETHVLYVEPAYRRNLLWIPNDTYFNNQWQLRNSGGGIYGIGMPDAWEKVDSTLDTILGAGDHYGGISSVVVAVLDTGLAMNTRTVDQPGTYEDAWLFNSSAELPINVWTNSSETPANGIDDDFNGYIDDASGVNIDDYYNYEYFYGGHTIEDGYADDDYGHGTFVSGIIAGHTNNNSQGAGVAFNTTIMPVKIFDYLGSVWSYSIIEGLSYAINNGADVINMSFGGPDPSSIEESLIEQATSEGIISIAASGNTGSPSIQYPAGYSNVIAVGASKPNGGRDSYSSYGGWLDLVAPVGETSLGEEWAGFFQYDYNCFFAASQSNPFPCTSDTSHTWDPEINSFSTGNFSFSSAMGTSFAAPQVSALAALTKSIYSDINIYQFRNLINGNTTNITNGCSLQTGAGILNATAAIDFISTVQATSNPNSNPNANGDAFSDLIAMNKITTAVDVTPSDGDTFGGGYRGFQQWSSKTYYAKDWEILKPADVNGDGNIDIVAFNPETTQVNVTLSNGSKFGYGFGCSQIWNKRTSYSSNDWILLDPSDVNGDGKADLIAFNTNTTAIDVTLSDGLTFGGGYRGYQVWNSRSSYSTKDWKLLPPSDVNGDGLADIIAFNNVSSQVDVTLSSGTNFGGGYKGYQIWNSKTYYGHDWTLLDPGDINGDNRADLIAFQPSTTKVDVTLSTGANFGSGWAGYEVWNAKTYFAKDWVLLSPTDVDGDNMVDLIAFQPSTTKVDVIRSTGTDFGNGWAGYEVWNSRTSYSPNEWEFLD